jgi:hypothetical protein
MSQIDTTLDNPKNHPTDMHMLGHAQGTDPTDPTDLVNLNEALQQQPVKGPPLTTLQMMMATGDSRLKKFNQQHMQQMDKGPGQLAIGMSPAEQQAAHSAMEQQIVGEQQQRQQQRLQQYTQQNPVAGGSINLGQGVIAGANEAGSQVVGLFNPTAAAAMQQGIQATNPSYGLLGDVGTTIGQAVPTLAVVAVNPGVGALAMGATAAGQTRTDIAQQRKQGEQISGKEELAASLVSGGINTFAGLLMPELGESEAITFLDKASALLKGSAQSGLLNSVVQIANNGVRKGYDPQAAWDDALVQAGITGAAFHALSKQFEEAKGNGEQEVKSPAVSQTGAEQPFPPSKARVDQERLQSDKTTASNLFAQHPQAEQDRIQQLLEKTKGIPKGPIPTTDKLLEMQQQKSVEESKPIEKPELTPEQLRHKGAVALPTLPPEVRENAEKTITAIKGLAEEGGKRIANATGVSDLSKIMTTRNARVEAAVHSLERLAEPYEKMVDKMNLTNAAKGRIVDAHESGDIVPNEFGGLQPYFDAKREIQRVINNIRDEMGEDISRLNPNHFHYHLLPDESPGYKPSGGKMREGREQFRMERKSNEGYEEFLNRKGEEGYHEAHKNLITQDLMGMAQQLHSVYTRKMLIDDMIPAGLASHQTSISDKWVKLPGKLTEDYDMNPEQQLNPETGRKKRPFLAVTPDVAKTLEWDEANRQQSGGLVRTALNASMKTHLLLDPVYLMRAIPGSMGDTAGLAFMRAKSDIKAGENPLHTGYAPSKALDWGGKILKMSREEIAASDPSPDKHLLHAWDDAVEAGARASSLEKTAKPDKEITPLTKGMKKVDTFLHTTGRMADRMRLGYIALAADLARTHVERGQWTQDEANEFTERFVNHAGRTYGGELPKGILPPLVKETQKLVAPFWNFYTAGARETGAIASQLIKGGKSVLPPALAGLLATFGLARTATMAYHYARTGKTGPLAPNNPLALTFIDTGGKNKDGSPDITYMASLWSHMAIAIDEMSKGEYSKGAANLIVPHPLVTAASRFLLGVDPMGNRVDNIAERFKNVFVDTFEPIVPKEPGGGTNLLGWFLREAPRSVRGDQARNVLDDVRKHTEESDEDRERHQQDRDYAQAWRNGDKTKLGELLDRYKKGDITPAEYKDIRKLYTSKNTLAEDVKEANLEVHPFEQVWDAATPQEKHELLYMFYEKTRNAKYITNTEKQRLYTKAIDYARSVGIDPRKIGELKDAEPTQGGWDRP